MSGVSHASFLGTLSQVPLLPGAPATPPPAARVVASSAGSAETTPVASPSTPLVERNISRPATPATLYSCARVVFGSRMPVTIASPATPPPAARVIASSATSATTTPPVTPPPALLLARNISRSATPSSLSSGVRIVFGSGTPEAAASPATPPPGARVAGEPTRTDTPLAIRNLGRRPKVLLEESPDRGGKEQVAEGLSALSRMEPDRRLRAAVNLWDIFKRSISGEDSATPGFHRTADLYFKNGTCSRTGTGVVKVLSGILGVHARIVPVAHLSGEERSGGGHLHYLLEEVLARNPATGVCFGRVRSARDKPKYSSVFPTGIEMEHVIAMLQNATTTVIASHANRCLQRTESGLIIECYFRDPIGFSSAFPIFFIGGYQEGLTYQLTDTATVSAEAVLEFARGEVRERVAKDGNPVSYFLSKDGEIEEVIIDLAPYLLGIPVARGILFSFSRGLAPDLFACFPPSFFTSVSRTHPITGLLTVL